MDSQIAELARLIDPDAWTARDEDQVTLGSSFELKCRRMHSMDTALRIQTAGYVAVEPPNYIEAATRRAETGSPETVSTGTVGPLVLEDLRRLVVATAGWSPVTVVRVKRHTLNAVPKQGETTLTVVRGGLAAHRKIDLRESEKRDG